ncbi:hypothetical protein DICA4_C05248 [Diutina catenulata]
MARWLKPVDLRWGTAQTPLTALAHYTSPYLPPPQPVSGVFLLQKQLNYAAKGSKFTLRRRLGDQSNKIENPDPGLFEHEQRIWHGYEVVEHNRRHSDDANPYVGSGLWPWEIIKDKLRYSQDREEFEVDLYDEVIDLAMGRKPLAVVGEWVDRPPTDAWLRSHYNLVGLATGRERMAFFNFYRDYAVPARLKAWRADKDPQAAMRASTAWYAMSENTRMQYGLPRGVGQTRYYKECMLDLHTAIVLDFVCYGWLKNGYDWMADYRKVVEPKGLTYVNRMYTDLDFKSLDPSPYLKTQVAKV